MLIDELFVGSLRLTQWFADNQMKANPGKFQAIAVGKHIHNEDISFKSRDDNTVSHADKTLKMLTDELVKERLRCFQ